MKVFTSMVLLGLASLVPPAGQVSDAPPVAAPAARTPAPVARPSATPDARSVWVTGAYRNLFRELGKSDAEIEAKVDLAVDAFFHGDETLRCYYPVGSDEAYILDSSNNDIRSEGQAYGMLIAVQAGLRPEFDRLWNYASRRMRHTSGDRQGYFAWHLSPEGRVLDANSASDGEEFFAMALYFAWKRWDDAAYKAAADDILHHMLHQDRYVAPGATVTRMIDPTTNLIVFVPEGQGATFTDPYYNLPAFYELFAHWAGADNDSWRQVAQASRAYFPTAAHPTTGLFPDYSLFDGQPTDPSNSGHTDFRYDAWRVIQSLALDSYWFGIDPWQVAAVDRIQGFFAGRGLTTYGHLFTLEGAPLPGGNDHSAGLVAMNAVGSLVATHPRAMDFVRDLWTIQPTRGRYRYFDGCLYVMGLLHCSGRFQIIGGPGSRAHAGAQKKD